MYYRVQVHGEIIGNYLENPQIKYQFFGINSVETLDKEYQNNIIYKTKNKFEYSIFLDHPTTIEILQAKNLIRQKMLQELQKIIDNLSNIKKQLQMPIQFQ